MPKNFLKLLAAGITLLSLSACDGADLDGAASESVQTSLPASEQVSEAVSPSPSPTPEVETISIDGVEFYPIELSDELLDTMETGDGTLPGERSETVTEVKTALYGYEPLEFVAYSQMRPEVADLFDSHQEALVDTLYDFYQLEQEPVLDELTGYLLEALPTLPEAMQQDVYSVYKARIIEAGIDGTLLRSGESLGLYYVAQTDPDWSSYPFPNVSDPDEADDTVRDRSCGVMSMTMAASTYLHRELDPLELVDYVVDNGYRVSVSGVEDTFMLAAAELYGLEAPVIYYRDPAEGQQALDWDYIRDYIDENNALAIVHVQRGNFTSRQHYMVLNDYVELDGTGYFLIADPYQLRSRYDQWGTASMADPEMGDDGMIYATPELVAESASAVILFEGDKDAYELSCASTQPTQLG